MKLKVLATRDIVANVYGQPMFVIHVGHAIRSFGDECQNKDKGNALGAHPEDYELFELGEYDDVTGKFELLENPNQLAVGANYRGH